MQALLHCYSPFLCPRSTPPSSPHPHPLHHNPSPPLQLTSSRTDAEQYLTPRHLVDLFREFCTLPVSAVLPCLRPLQPRMYSISSSMREDPRKVQVTIAVVRYESLGHERVGVCSTYCGERLEVRAVVG